MELLLVFAVLKLREVMVGWAWCEDGVGVVRGWGIVDFWVGRILCPFCYKYYRVNLLK